MDTDSTAVIRFLPDADNSNTFFWRERQIIKMTFLGVKGGDTSKPVTVQVPCVEMWGDTCPVHAEIRPVQRSQWKTLDESIGRSVLTSSKVSLFKIQ